MLLIPHTFLLHPDRRRVVSPNATLYRPPRTDLRELEEIFRSKVRAMLKREDKPGAKLIEKLTGWPHSSFSVPAGNRTARNDLCDTR